MASTNNKKDTATPKLKYVRIAGYRCNVSQSTVENPMTESKVFIEFQIRSEFVHRTSSGLLLSHHASFEDRVEQNNQMGRRIFQGDSADFFAFDVFRNWDISSLMHICRCGTNSFWRNIVGRQINSICKEVAQTVIKRKPSIILVGVNVKVLLLTPLDDEIGVNSLDVCRRFRPLPELPDVTMFDDIEPRKFGDEIYDDDGNDDSFTNSCVICSYQFEKGNDVLEMLCCCKVFHPKCVLQWLNMHNHCPLCRARWSGYTENTKEGHKEA